jgi:hypothetical protein
MSDCLYFRKIRGKLGVDFQPQKSRVFKKPCVNLLDLKQKASYHRRVNKNNQSIKIMVWRKVSKIHVQGIFRALFLVGSTNQEGGEADIASIVCC